MTGRPAKPGGPQAAGMDAAQLLEALAALANPHRLRIIAALHTGGRAYVSQLARDVGISRPLLHLHLQKLEAAGLVRSTPELGPDGRALNFMALSDFAITLTPAAIAAAIAAAPDLAASDPIPG